MRQACRRTERHACGSCSDTAYKRVLLSVQSGQSWEDEDGTNNATVLSTGNASLTLAAAARWWQAAVLLLVVLLLALVRGLMGQEHGC